MTPVLMPPQNLALSMPRAGAMPGSAVRDSAAEDPHDEQVRLEFTSLTILTLLPACWPFHCSCESPPP